MELPTEILSEITGHLEDSTSFRDLRIAFTCKELYREYGPQIVARQTDLLEDAFNRSVLFFEPTSPLRYPEYSKADFRSVTLRQREDGYSRPPVFSNVRGNLTLIVKSRHDIDLIWSVHNLLARAPKLDFPTLDCFHLILRSTEVELPTDVLLNLTYKQMMEATYELAKGSVVYWGDEKDQRDLAHALHALSLVAMTLIDTQLQFSAELSARLEEPIGQYLFPSRHPAVRGARGNVRLSKLKFTSVPTPRLLPAQTIDAIVQASSTSLTELHIEHTSGKDAWAAMLDRWSLPQLATLFIKHADVPLPNLIAFLDRNPSITMAALEMDGIPSTLTEPMQCSALHELTATPELLLPLLHDMSVTFPSLNSLKIAQKMHGAIPDFSCSDLNDLTTILSRIPATMPALHTLSLDLVYRDGLYKWLADADIPTTEPPNPKPADEETAPGAIQGNSSISEALQQRRSLAGTVASLHNITNLSFKVSEDNSGIRTGIADMTSPIYINPAPVVRLLAAFPALETAYLRGLFCQQGRRCTVEAGVAGAGRVCHTPDEFWLELSQVWKGGPGLQRLELFDAPGLRCLHGPAVWRRGDVDPVEASPRSSPEPDAGTDRTTDPAARGCVVVQVPVASRA